MQCHGVLLVIASGDIKRISLVVLPRFSQEVLPEIFSRVFSIIPIEILTYLNSSSVFFPRILQESFSNFFAIFFQGFLQNFFEEYLQCPRNAPRIFRKKYYALLIHFSKEFNLNSLFRNLQRFHQGLFKELLTNFPKKKHQEFQQGFCLEIFQGLFLVSLPLYIKNFFRNLAYDLFKAILGIPLWIF